MWFAVCGRLREKLTIPCKHVSTQYIKYGNLISIIFINIRYFLEICREIYITCSNDNKVTFFTIVKSLHTHLLNAICQLIHQTGWNYRFCRKHRCSRGSKAISVCRVSNEVTLRTLEAHHVNQVNVVPAMKAGSLVAGEIRFSFPPAVPIKFDQQRRILVGCDGVITLLRHFADNSANKRATTDEEKSTNESSVHPWNFVEDKLLRVYHLYNDGRKFNITFIPLIYIAAHSLRNIFYFNFPSFILN